MQFWWLLAQVQWRKSNFTNQRKILGCYKRPPNRGSFIPCNFEGNIQRHFLRGSSATSSDPGHFDVTSKCTSSCTSATQGTFRSYVPVVERHILCNFRKTSSTSCNEIMGRVARGRSRAARLEPNIAAFNFWELRFFACKMKFFIFSRISHFYM